MYSSSEPAIVVDCASKMYKVYDNKRDKVLDLLNINIPFMKRRCTEYWALRDITLSIPKGEKIGILGRNGAGKSTLLKMIAGNLMPTEGNVNVNGKVSALLELGTGFHPEFSGRENIFAALSYMGVTGAEAKKKFFSILEFSELEDFIEKPIKTYSAGMYTRLAFSVATSITPEILIIDEVLGAGDAYFLGKSIERMKMLTEGGATVLFVSHDIHAVQKMCNKAIWLDHGKIVMAGDTLSVSKEYLHSIRRQDEVRLKAKNSGVSRALMKQLNYAEKCIGHLITDTGAPKEDHLIGKIRILKNAGILDELIVGDAMDNGSERELSLLVNSDTINWSNPLRVDNRYARAFRNVGGEYEHAVFLFYPPAIRKDETLAIEIEYKDSSEEKVHVEVFDGKGYIRIGTLETLNDNKWKCCRMPIPATFFSKEAVGNTSTDEQESMEELEVGNGLIGGNSSDTIPHDRNSNDVYGSGEVIITNVRFRDGSGVEKYVHVSGEELIIRIEYQANAKIVAPIFVVAVYAMDGTCITQLISIKDGANINAISGAGFAEIELSPLLIGKGDYVISAAVFKSMNLLDPVESQAYDLHDRKYSIKVVQPFGINIELGTVVHPAHWRISHE